MRCHFCHRPVTVRDGWLEFYSITQDGELRYPSHAGRPAALFTHTACGPDVGYALALSRCVGIEAKYGLLHHVGTKVWCRAAYLDALRQAQAFVQSQQRKPLD